MNIQELKDKPFELLTWEERNELNVHYLHEISQKGITALNYMRFYLFLFTISTILFFISYFDTMQYLDKPLLYLIISILSSMIYVRNKKNLLFLGRLFELLEANCKFN